MTLLIIFIVICVLIGILLGIRQTKHDNELDAEKRKTEAQLGRVAGFVASQKLMGTDGRTGIAVDEQHDSLCLLTLRQGKLSQRVVPRQGVLSVEVFEDGESVTRTVRSSQVMSALAGKIFYGDTGAIIGGLSGKTRTEGRVSQIDLRLVVNDTAAPLHDVSILDTDVPKGGIRYNEAMNRARHWHGIVEVLIKRADKQERAQEAQRVAAAAGATATANAGQAATPAAARPAPTAPPTQAAVSRPTAQALPSAPAAPPMAAARGTAAAPPASIADELKKLADLHTAGALSDEEFREAKARALDGPV